MKYPAFVFALWLALLSAQAEDWPRFLGPRGDNTSTETGLLEKFPTNGVPVVWEKKIGTGYSAPSVRGGQVVLHHRVGGEEVVESFNAASTEHFMGAVCPIRGAGRKRKCFWSFVTSGALCLICF